MLSGYSFIKLIVSDSDQKNIILFRIIESININKFQICNKPHVD